MADKKPNKYKKKENGKNDTGRPTSMTAETLQKLETALKMGCSDTIACQHAGIARSTLYDYQREHPEFSAKMAFWKANPILKAQNNVMKILNGARSLLEKKYDKETGEEIEDPRGEISTRDILELSKWYLEHKNKEDYGTRVELTGADGTPLQSGSSIQEMIALREEMKRISDESKDKDAEK